MAHFQKMRHKLFFDTFFTAYCRICDKVVLDFLKLMTYYCRLH